MRTVGSSSHAAGLVAVVGLLLFASPGGISMASALSLSAHAPGGGAHASAVPGSDGVTGRVSAQGAASAGLPPVPEAPPPSIWNSSGACGVLQDHWNASFADRPPPLDVQHGLQRPCYIGHDEPAMSFISNASYSGARVQFSLTLPAGGTSTSSAFSTFWLGMWLAGVPCSYRGQSYLEVQLNPPYDALGIGAGPNWTVQAPVWDLVPAGSCDPQCQNDSVSTTLDGIGYCEDDAALSGVGTYTSSGWGSFAPGDGLTVAMVGAVGGATGLSVYLNDTTTAGNDLSWTYSSQVSASGRPLTPFYNASTESAGGWGYGLNVEAAWENCPEAAGPTPCNSYDGPAVSAVGVPTIGSAVFWNSTSRSYANPFAWTATSSSSGGCAGSSPSVTPCADFTSWGGTGAYPFWSLHASQGRSWWTFGGTYPDQVADFGGPVGQFSPSGLPPTYLDPVALNDLVISSGAGSVAVRIHAAAPGDIAAVHVAYQWCASMGSGNTSLGGGAGNTSRDGIWTTNLTTSGYRGTLHLTVRARSAAGVWSAPVYATSNVAGTTPCTFAAPPAPWFGGANVTSVAGGYRVSWAENSSALRNMTLWVNASQNGTPYSLDLAPTGPTILPVANLSVGYGFRLLATDWANNSSSPSPWTIAPPPGPALVAALSDAAPMILWAGEARPTFHLLLSGGAAPFRTACAFSDGTNATLSGPNRSVNFTHDFGLYYGTARVSCTVTDADGILAESNRVMVPIWATPLAVPQAVSAGDGWVNVSWSAPLSPAAPVTGYTVYFTTVPASARYLTAVWPDNASLPYGITLWNTTRTDLLVPVADGTTFFAQVVAWNLYGEGLLPAGVSPLYLPPVLTAVPAPLSAGPISSSPGGPVPFQDTFSSWVTGGTNFSVVYAVYTFPGQVAVIPSIVPGGNGTWVNASYTFLVPGLQTVELHVVDSLYDTAIATTTVFVGPGGGPGFSVSEATTFGWVGQAMRFTASVTSGSGNYTYLWQFGDGGNGSGPKPSHTYLSAGTFGVTATVTDNGTGGTTTRQTVVTVYALPEVAIVTTAGPNGSLSYAFTAVSSGGSGTLAIVWLFGDGTVGHGATVVHDFGASGTYLVGVIATDPSNRAAYANITVSAVAPSGGAASGALSGTLVALVLGPVAIACFVGLLYFWNVARTSSSSGEEEEAERPRFPV